MNGKTKLALCFALILTVCQTASSQKRLSSKDMKPENLKPAMLYWDYGSPEYLTIETIYPLQDSANTYWNITHRTPVLDDSSGNGFDYYLVNQKDVRPIKSQMYHTEFTNYRIEYGKDSARIFIKTPTDTTNYSIGIPEYVAPEGPGTPVFLGSLPLSENYHVEYYELNRWTGAPPKTGRLELTTLKVVGSEVVKIDGKNLNTYKLHITTQNGRFTEIWALKKAPHYWVKVNHKIDENRTMKSKVVKLFILG